MCGESHKRLCRLFLSTAAALITLVILLQAFDKGREHIERMFDQLDANADGVVSCDEFLGYMVDKNTRMLKTEEVLPMHISELLLPHDTVGVRVRRRSVSYRRSIPPQ